MCKVYKWKLENADKRIMSDLINGEINWVHCLKDLLCLRYQIGISLNWSRALI